MSSSVCLLLCLMVGAASVLHVGAQDSSEDPQQLKLTRCYQSSTREGGVCIRAIDGIRNQNWHDQSCSLTHHQKGWWQASTEKIAFITHVRIYNRMDCCSEWLTDFTVLVGDQECESYKSDRWFSERTFECNKVGQEIRIRSNKHTHLSLCEVEVFGKVVNADQTQLKLTACTQSSTESGGVCERAIDGNKKQYWNDGSCAHTQHEKSWWQASIHPEGPAFITQVRIYNRMDCCSDELNDFSIMVGDRECESYKSDGHFSVRTFDCNAVGQSIRIRSNRMTWLMLCEVEVFGALIHGKQLGLTGCTQSSTDLGGVCGRAIDGIRNQNFTGGSCTYTNDENGWWQASTEKAMYITQVRIYNRLDCCSDRLNDITILVGDQECASYRSDHFFSARTFECNVFGQKIRIRNNKKSPFSLCEVEVFGESMIGQQLTLTQCSQSSTDHDGVCDRAIDGMRKQVYHDQSCSHTREEKGWWQASIGRHAKITQVRIYNRIDCCSDRLTDFTIVILNSSNGEYYNNILNSAIFYAQTFRIAGDGDIVRIENRKATPLTLCEVEVFGLYL